MLRTATDLRSRFGSSRRLRGACVGVLAVMAIAIAGVRRPESGVAAEAGSSSPPAAVAAKPVERIPLSLVPADTVYAVSVRPAELLENELYGPLVSEIDELKPLAESSVSVRDIAEFMVIVPGSPYAQERFVVRFASQQACLDFVNAMLQRQQFEGAVDPNGPWRDGSEQITKVDQSTLAIEHFATPEAHGASLPPLHSHLVHGWAEAWQQRAEQPWVAAISVAARPPLSPEPGPRQWPSRALGSHSTISGNRMHRRSPKSCSATNGMMPL